MNCYFFRTPVGARYGFDGRTGEIVSFSPSDFDDLQSSLEDNRQVEFSDSLEKIVLDGFFSGSPVERKKAKKVLYKNEVIPLEKFFSQFRTQLILEVTEACNLRCRYCIFGEHQAHSFREHSDKLLPDHIAFDAVNEFLMHSVFPHAILFYGGEPLLEFALIQRTVHHAEKIAADLNKVPFFGITTNGTLLDEEKIKFFIEHGFSVLISLDGPKEIHDQHRLYACTSNGTYDDIYNNILKIKSYNGEKGKAVFGCIATMIPPMCWRERNDFFASIYDDFPVKFCNFLHSDTCKPSTCRNNGNWQRGDSDDSRELSLLLSEFYDLLIVDPKKAQRRYPLIALIANSRLGPIHYRNIRSPNHSVFLHHTCLPGYNKLFCDVNGNYYPCERTYRNKFFYLGNVSTGFSADNTIKLLDEFHKLGECEECLACSLCEICFSDIKLDGACNLDQDYFTKKCHALKQSFKHNIVDYSNLMEKDRTCVDALLARDDNELTEGLFFITE